ncbi:hypothetical protein PRZ48_000027 [Zasmidium cellare]|uniref:Transmembrane protein n=1 Tax=Zasmidium cellare TaxID=395010 RepID=A0ABR0EXD1_ZASCE|nr:hypothetical protein PRZ48_000027 [Zasmidium cellare]
MITLVALYALAALMRPTVAQYIEFYSGEQCNGASQQIIDPANTRQCYDIPGDTAGAEVALLDGTVVKTYTGGSCANPYGEFTMNPSCVLLESQITGIEIVSSPTTRDVDVALEKRDFALLIFSAGAGLIFSGLNGLATSCLGGDWSTPRKATAAGISCVVNTLQTAFGAYLAAKTFAGAVAAALALGAARKRDGITGVEFEHPRGVGYMYMHPAHEGEFGTEENPAYIYLDKDDESSHLVYWKSNTTHHVRKGVGHNIDPLSKRDAQIDMFYDWNTNDTGNQPAASDESTLANDFVNWLQSQDASDEACVAICNSGATVSEGYIGFVQHGAQVTAPQCDMSCS